MGSRFGFTVSVLYLVAALGAACDDAALGIPEGEGTGGFDLAAPRPGDRGPFVDLAQGQRDLGSPGDLSGLGGIECGMQTCLQDTVCCVSGGPGGNVATDCLPLDQCNVPGVLPLTCDGPEDCVVVAPSCCIKVGLGGGGGGTFTGSATCNGSCPGAITIGGGAGGMISTQLCHSMSDCIGYTGTAPILGSGPFDRCCGLPGISFRICAPQILSSLGMGITCN